MKDEIIFSQSAGTLIASITCDIDHHMAKPMREKIDRMLFEIKPQRLVLDFSAVTFMDTSGLGLIIGRGEKARALGVKMSVIGLSPTLMKLVKLSGIEKLDHISLGQ